MKLSLLSDKVESYRILLILLITETAKIEKKTIYLTFLILLKLSDFFIYIKLVFFLKTSSCPMQKNLFSN